MFQYQFELAFSFDTAQLPVCYVQPSNSEFYFLVMQDLPTLFLIATTLT